MYEYIVHKMRRSLNWGAQHVTRVFLSLLFSYQRQKNNLDA